MSSTSELAVRRSRWRQRQLLARPVRRRLRGGELVARRVAVGPGEVLEVRP
ncbi:MAG: hypothetical protein JJE35_14525 [Thermoleophilia bacterium]|nr:hypothetical protein [Thermoleophilia bacterium]